jgi:hypothetical protein
MDNKVKIAKSLEVVVAHFKVVSQNGSDRHQELTVYK